VADSILRMPGLTFFPSRDGNQLLRYSKRNKTRGAPGDRREVPIEFFKLPKCKKTFRLSPGFRMGPRSNEPALEWLKEKVGSRGYQ
jgi:hypothetical protein